MGQAQNKWRVKPANGIPTLSPLILTERWKSRMNVNGCPVLGGM